MDKVVHEHEEQLDFKTIEEEFRDGLGSVFEEIKEIKLKTKAEIASMSQEQFFKELELLDKQYEAKAQKVSRRKSGD